MNLTDLTDEDLEAHAENVRQEQARRQNLAQIPDTISALKDKYVNAGGDLSELS